MGGETEDKVSGWTVDTLRASIDERFNDLRRLMDERQSAAEKASDLAAIVQQTAMKAALEAADKAVQTAMSAAEKAVNKAEIAADKRFENMNEFRQQLADQATTFMPRSEAQVSIKSMEEKIAVLNSQLDAIRGAENSTTDHKLDSNRIMTIILSALAIAVALYAVLKP